MSQINGLEDSQNYDSSQQVLLLTERLREQNGGKLDDEAILAVAEATGAPTEFIRLALQLRSKKSASQQVMSVIMSLEPDVRRHLVSGFVGTLCGLLVAATDRTGQEIFSTLMLIGIGVAAWNAAISKERRTAAITGALFGGVFFVATSLFEFMFKTGQNLASPLLIFALGGGAVGGLVLQSLVNKNRDRLGLKDPQQERKELLRQLVDLQEKLRSGEQAMTFLCVDVVGSTQLKASADPLSVEYTLSEYHTFVEMIARRYAGRIHSTAGDGVICAFEHPQQGFGAARNLQAGLAELNTFRNKIGTPLQLRIAVHSGDVVAPDVTDVTSINFAHVIDIASHLQRVCPVGGVVVSDDAAKHLPGGPGAVGPDKVQVHGVSGYVWMPRSSAIPMSLNPSPQE